jgi:hypothetical protein
MWRASWFCTRWAASAWTISPGCAKTLGWPEEEHRPEGAGPLRYVAIRFHKRQHELFADGAVAKYFVHHARQILLKVGRLSEQLREWAEGLRLLPAAG